jgi:hypothetical protein
MSDCFGVYCESHLLRHEQQTTLSSYDPADTKSSGSALGADLTNVGRQFFEKHALID